ncbi:MAG: hypothetical protein K9M49_07725 [Candidatus Marinimicrobia bacterium]|nr:hypothetical protein [Candidatus Neomarinimicrobiota bacterium]MCF7850956.1 hypothetical protein [Candidatus Neomarinimicrobiota bacterium]MCF7905028.1 hypothetical protein [Candidatus Neomarinimicrobiota bacterium]
MSELRRLLFIYLPYGAIDLILTLAIILELLTKRYELLWANVPILIWGLISFNRKVKTLDHDISD